MSSCVIRTNSRIQLGYCQTPTTILLKKYAEIYNFVFVLIPVGMDYLCGSDPCMNGGTCNGNSVDSPCLCQTGFTGSFCEGKREIIIITLR